MRFRLKLLLLLLGISLVPLLLLRITNQSAVHEMGEELARRIRSQLIHRSSIELKQRVSDHAFVMSRERQLLELALQSQAAAVLEFVEGEDSTYNTTTSAAPLDMELQALRHCRLANSGQCLPGELVYDKFTLYSGQNTVTTELSGLTPIFRQMAGKLQDLLLWQYVALLGGQSDTSVLAVYPANDLEASPSGIARMGRGRWMMMHEGPWAEEMERMHQRHMGNMPDMQGQWDTMYSPEMDSWSGDLPAWHHRALEEGAPVWGLPEQDPLTGKLVVTASMPIHGQNKEVLGSTALVVLVDALLHTERHSAMFSPEQETLMVYPVEEGTAPEGSAVEGPALRILAQTSMNASQQAHSPDAEGQWHMRGWQAPEAELWIDSTDTAGLAKVTADMEAGRTNVLELPYKGRPSLWAYGPIEAGGASLLIITPKTSITAEAENTREYILGQFQQAILFSGFLVAIVICGIVLLALVMARRLTRRIEELARGFDKVAGGDFTVRVPMTSNDEIGQLAQGFNDMVPALEERCDLNQSLEVAHEIQRSLLPHTMPKIRDFALAGTCVYSETTGGDYFDIICPSNVIVCSLDGRPQSVPAPDLESPAGPELLGLAVGDVTGHGLPAALLMTTARAFLRQRASLPGGPGEVLVDVNRQMYNDVDQTGRFMTMFYAVLEPEKKLLRWSRAGHDPALLYDPETDEFVELAGEGLPLGTVQDWPFEEQEIVLRSGHLLCIATDGVWEAENKAGEMYGKERLMAVLRKYAKASPDEALQAVLDDLRRFMGAGRTQGDVQDGIANSFEDDVTLLLLKAL